MFFCVFIIRIKDVPTRLLCETFEPYAEVGFHYLRSSHFIFLRESRTQEVCVCNVCECASVCVCVTSHVLECLPPHPPSTQCVYSALDTQPGCQSYTTPTHQLQESNITMVTSLSPPGRRAAELKGSIQFPHPQPTRADSLTVTLVAVGRDMCSLKKPTHTASSPYTHLHTYTHTHRQPCTHTHTSRIISILGPTSLFIFTHA